MNHVSLFSGIGGIDLAAEWAGFETVAVVEQDKFCRAVLARHFPEAVQFEDVRNVTGELIRSRTGCERIDLLSGGFPCQDVSIVGKRAGISGERTGLWGEMLRIVTELQPVWVLAENVPGLLSGDAGRWFEQVVHEMAEAGYNVGWSVHGADDVGAPHRRKRVFIVGRRLENAECIGYGGGCDGDESGSGCQIQTPGSCGKLADGWRERLEGDRETRPAAGSTGRGGRTDFPPRPGELDRWRELLRGRPDLAPALTKEDEAELSVHGETDGFSRKLALKALGNAAVPQQVYPILAAIAKHLRSDTATMSQ